MDEILDKPPSLVDHLVLAGPEAFHVPKEIDRFHIRVKVWAFIDPLHVAVELCENLLVITGSTAASIEKMLSEFIKLRFRSIIPEEFGIPLI